MEAARKFQGDGRHAPEDAIHNLVFKRFNDNVSLNYFEHNLWLVDDALALMPYISSDRILHGGRRRSGDKVTDLLFFDDSMVLGDENATTLTWSSSKDRAETIMSSGRKRATPHCK
ncbi:MULTISPECIES: hypothetical protein [Bradyrhizobium]|uniref:Uncharacterized protein n=1 Tax=Bradyrhizobium vignae TaxID=1549949 RepID=A0ABS3ZR96_9BRAD|nr:hypothetical protein [Bradyrhizobium vignae]MBP0110646.1 hypothetical protein [Bradyrhizobium vignae]